MHFSKDHKGNKIFGTWSTRKTYWKGLTLLSVEFVFAGNYIYHFHHHCRLGSIRQGLGRYPNHSFHRLVLGAFASVEWF